MTAAARRNETSPLSRLKAIGYLDNILAMRAAIAATIETLLAENLCANVTRVAELIERHCGVGPVTGTLSDAYGELTARSGTPVV